MILSILTSCHTPAGAPSPDQDQQQPHYVKASAKRLSMPASPLKKRNSRLKRKSVVIGTPSGFKHEFHLGRDVNSMSELWDLERWREEIENRVQEAAAQHAAINAAAAAAAEEEESTSAPTKRPRPQSMIKRKPVPSLDPNAEPAQPSTTAPSEPVPPLPTISPPSPESETGLEADDTLPRASGESSATTSCSGHDLFSSDETEDTCSVASSLPPSTPPSSNSPRASTDLKYVDLPPVIETRPEAEEEELSPMTFSAAEFTLSRAKSKTIQYGQALSCEDDDFGDQPSPLHGDIAVIIAS